MRPNCILRRAPARRLTALLPLWWIDCLFAIFFDCSRLRYVNRYEFDTYS
jgi:hypothetical protein